MKKAKTKKVVIDSNTGEVKPTPQIKTQLTAKYFPQDHERAEKTKPSRTVPGQSMSVTAMLKRHRMGLPITESKGALYQGDELLPDISMMDEIDKAELMDKVADALVEVRQRIDEQAKTKAEKEFLAKVDKEVREQLSKMTEKPKGDSQEAQPG